MKLPTFKPSKLFLDDIQLPCLVAKVKNSDLPGVATRHIRKYKKDSMCEIFLRGKDSTNVSAWQARILGRLLVDEGLAAAVEEAMKQYGKSDYAYFGTAPRERKQILERGVAPFMTISTIVVDEIKREVILAAHTEWDLNLYEHGISIYMRKGRWRLDDADYFINYQSSLVKRKKLTRAEMLEEQAAAMQEAAAELRNITTFFEKKTAQWDEVFPVPKRAVLQADPTFLYGDWEFDAGETRKVLRRLGEGRVEIANMIEDSEAVGGVTYRFAPELMRMTTGDGVVDDILIGCERRGNRVTVFYRIKDGESTLSAKHWYEGDLLIEESGLVYRRVKAPAHKLRK